MASRGAESEDSANTSVMAWNGRVFALFEGNVPTELSPEDLRSLGETNLDVIVSSFSAHPRFMPAK